MSRSRILSSIATASLGIALLGACGGESLTERAASFGLEQAIDGDQDIDLDFDSDGSGGFSISTDEGDFSLNFDEDNGGIVFNTDEGDGVISFDEDGVVFNTDEGDGTATFDDNGAFTIETEDGGLGVFNSGEAPSSWPTQIGLPSTLVPGSQSYSVLELGDAGAVTTGVFNHAPNEPFAATIIANLVSSGWNVTISNEQDGTLFAQLDNGSGAVAQVIGDDSGYTTVSFTQP
jgi:hypothetical protein